MLQGGKRRIPRDRIREDSSLMDSTLVRFGGGKRESSPEYFDMTNKKEK